MKKRRLYALFLAAAVLLTLSACGGGNGSSSGGGEKIATIGFTTAWGDFDPYYSVSETMYEMALYDKIYDKLVFTDLAGTEILPRGAVSWESADDGYAAVFHLDERSTFSDGVPVTAEDWVFTAELLANPRCPFPNRIFTQLFTGTDDSGVTLEGDRIGVEALDPYTLKLNFKKPTDPVDFLLDYNRQYVLLPKHLLKDVEPEKILDAEFWLNPVGSGPCVYESQMVGSQMVLIPNPYYPLRTGNWDKLILRVLDSSNLLNAMMTGEIDMNELGSDIRSDAKAVAESGGLTVRDTQIRNFFMEVLMNSNNIPDPRIRQAFHYATDKDAIITAFVEDVASPAYGYELISSEYHDDSLAFPRDVEKARALLEEAGYDGRPYTIAFASKRQNMAALLAQQWAEAGLNIKLMVVDVTTMFAGLRDGTFDLGLSGHTASAYSLWFEGNFPANSSDYEPDPIREDYVARIGSEMDHEKKVELVKDYQRYLQEQAYFIPLYFSGNYWVESSRVSGIRDSASMMCNDNVWEWVVK